MVDEKKAYDAPDPSPSVGDAVQRVARAALSTIPGVGGAAAQLLDSVFTPPMAKRQREWQHAVAETLRRLEQERGIDAEMLRNNDAFIDVALQATQVAMHSSQKEKLDALRAAVFNAGLPSAPDQSLQQMFLTYVDTLTVWHLHVLDLFNDPRGWFERNQRPLQRRVSVSSLSDTLHQAFPELRGHDDFCERLWADLRARGLVEMEWHGSMTPQGAIAPRTTSHAKAFLAFISQA